MIQQVLDDLIKIITYVIVMDMSLLLLTWIWNSEPFGIFYHRDSGVSSRHVLRNAGIRRKTSCRSNDGANNPGCYDGQDDLHIQKIEIQ